MGRAEDSDIVDVAKQIEQYLAKHPHAADSAEGVLHWWLGQQWFEESVDKVQQALDYLVKQGEITKAVTPGGREIYSSVKGSRSPEKKQ